MNGGCAGIIVAIAIFVLVSAISRLIDAISRLIEMLTNLLYLFGMVALCGLAVYLFIIAVDYLRNVHNGNSPINRVFDHYFPKRRFDLPPDIDMDKPDHPFISSPRDEQEGLDLNDLPMRRKEKVSTLMDDYWDG